MIMKRDVIGICHNFKYLRLRSTRCPDIEADTVLQPPPIRRPWLACLNIVQTLLDIYRTSSTSKFQTFAETDIDKYIPSTNAFHEYELIRENGENYGIQHEIH